jgi:hypothetical protein
VGFEPHLPLRIGLIVDEEEEEDEDEPWHLFRSRGSKNKLVF